MITLLFTLQDQLNRRLLKILTSEFVRKNYAASRNFLPTKELKFGVISAVILSFEFLVYFYGPATKRIFCETRRDG